MKAAGLAATVIGVIGLLGMWAGGPWLVPSLGPTLALQAASPELEASKPRSVLLGHAVGIAAGFLAVWVTGAAGAPAVAASGELVGARVAAAVLAVGLSMAGQALLRAEHPPAQANTLLIALGAMRPELRTVVTLTGR